MRLYNIKEGACLHVMISKKRTEEPTARAPPPAEAGTAGGAERHQTPTNKSANKSLPFFFFFLAGGGFDVDSGTPFFCTSYNFIRTISKKRGACTGVRG